MKPPKVLDNKKYRVVDELKAELDKGSKLSVISAYFTIYAYAELKKELSKIVKWNLCQGHFKKNLCS